MGRLRPEHIQTLYTYLQRQKGLSAGSVRSVHVVIHQGLAYATRVGSIERNVAGTDLIQLPKRKKRRPRAMTEEEVGRFLRAAREDRHHALWYLLLTGGLRPSEALGLTWDNVNMEGGAVRVEKSLSRVGVPEGKTWALTETKTAGSRRNVALPQTTMQALRKWKAEQARERLKAGEGWRDHGFVFTTSTGEPLDQTNLYARNFREVMRAAGLGVEEEVKEKPKGKPGPQKRPGFTPSYRMYDLRHTCATLLLRAGVNPKVTSERLGHSSVAFTLDVYTSSLPDMQGEAADKMEAIIGGANG